MELQTIKSEDLSVADLFKDFYQVPDYQREFVWSTEEVEQLMEDIHDEYQQKTEHYNPGYFIGTIVTKQNSDSLYEVIDGQQRITTLYICLCAIRDLVGEAGDEIHTASDQIASMSVNEDGTEVPRHRVSLQYVDSQRALEIIASTRADRPVDLIDTSTRSATNLVQAYRDIRAFMTTALDGETTNIRRFYAYLTKNVKLIRIRTESLSKALYVFETINRRGLGLDAMDLLKNLLFRHAKDTQFDQLKSRWKALVDNLYSSGEPPLRFIRYFILATYKAERLQADRVYEWLVDNRELVGYATQPVRFTDELLTATQAYTRFVAGQLPDGTPCRYLRNTWHMSHATRQHLVLMLSARHLPNEALTRLAEEVENLYFVFIVTRRPKNYFEGLFATWASRLRAMRATEELEQFLATDVREERDNLVDEFDLAFRRMTEINLPKYRLKYVLGKLAQHLDEMAYGTPADASLDSYVNSKTDIEHIAPLRASTRTIAAFGGHEEYEGIVHSIANLTLLERAINASAGAQDFEEKGAIYGKSRLLITRSLVPGSDVGSATSINRALAVLRPYTEWDPAAVADRADRLTALARRVWKTGWDVEDS